MRIGKYVVMATRIRSFETLDEALAFARLNLPSVVLERRDDGQGGTIAVEIMRHDWLYDAERREWRVMLG
ncbi:MAG TPA: hypothetical protein VGQ83_00120 [Polyangia bacterium]|jgi:hypothetical protein